VCGVCFVFLVTSQLRNMADHRCVILGHGPIARELASKIVSQSGGPFSRRRIFISRRIGDNPTGRQLARAGRLPRLRHCRSWNFWRGQQVQKLIIAMPQPDGPEIRKLIAECRKASVQVYLVPQLYDCLYQGGNARDRWSSTSLSTGAKYPCWKLNA